jgi:hypothetical protein
MLRRHGLRCEDGFSGESPACSRPQSDVRRHHPADGDGVGPRMHSGGQGHPFHADRQADVREPAGGGSRHRGPIDVQRQRGLRARGAPRASSAYYHCDGRHGVRVPLRSESLEHPQVRASRKGHRLPRGHAGARRAQRQDHRAGRQGRDGQPGIPFSSAPSRQGGRRRPATGTDGRAPGRHELRRVDGDVPAGKA